jgi:ABC-type spermidine/putrescine transport system permease subunit I
VTARYWRGFALPGVAWLCLFVVVPAYAVLAMAMGRVNLLLVPIPAWSPATWNPGWVSKAFSGALPGGEYWPAVRNTLVYVTASLGLCFAIGYPVAYYVARHAKRTKTLLVVLLVIPFWVSYLLRMLAWIGLLSTDGYVNKLLIDIGIAHPPNWLNGNAYSVILALVYGYIPYFILPVFAGLDRIDRSQIEAARDLGATPFQAFMRVTLPLSRPSILAGAALVVLPMFGDYYTNDLISASPRTNMLGNEINLFVQGGPEKNLGAALVLVLMAILLVLMIYYVVQTARDARRFACAGSARSSATRGASRASWWRSHGRTSPGPCCPCSSRCCSRSTTAGRAASGRGSRSAGGGATRTSRSSTIRSTRVPSCTAWNWPRSTC